MTSSYQKELEKYRDIDEDKILKELSAEELAQLDLELQEMDPEVRLDFCAGWGGRGAVSEPGVRPPQGPP